MNQKQPEEVNVEIEDSGSIGFSKDKKSFKSIVMDQYHKCCIEGSKEMTLGGVTTRFIDGEEVSYPVPNQVEIFTNSIDMLNNLLIAKARHNNKFIGGKINKFYVGMKDITKKREERKKKLIKEYNKKSTAISPEGYNQRQEFDPIYKKINNDIKKIYSSERLRWYKYLLEVHTLLLDKLNYFEE